MRTQMDLRARRACAAAAAVGVAYATHAALPASAQVTNSTAAAPIGASVPTASPTLLPARLNRAEVGGLSRPRRRRGQARTWRAGLPLALEYRAPSATAWHTLGTTRTGRTGAYSLTTRLGHSGTLRVSVVPSARRHSPSARRRSAARACPPRRRYRRASLSRSPCAPASASRPPG